MKRLLIPLVALALTACGGSRNVLTGAETPSTAPATTAPTKTLSVDDTARLVWASMNQEEQLQVCDLWIAAPAATEASFKRNASDPALADAQWDALEHILKEECP